ncbi:MAG: amino acid carrier protein [Oscillospiraceae bacterium]|nr:amino acid carrier protein [Oscillospiraceae bacterium]
MEIIKSIFESIYLFVWGPPMILILLLTGIILSFKSGFFQLIYLPEIFKKTFGSLFNGSKDGFKAMSVALGGTIGVGNIAGVAAAITIGGAGSIFWIWFSGLVGMMTKFSEICLAVEYSEKNERQETFGGPMIYIKKALPKSLHFLAYLFSVFCILASFFIGNMSQVNSVAFCVNSAFDISKLIVGISIALIILFLIGDNNRISNISALVVPLMSLLYIFATLFIIGKNIYFLPAAFRAIIEQAFGINSITGGISGAVIIHSMRVGISKGIFSHEAGMGSSPIAHASAKNADPVTQGMWGVIEVFIDTMIVCSLTAFAVLCSKEFRCGTALFGTELVNKIFSDTFGNIGSKYLAIATAMFAFASILGWAFYGKASVDFLFQGKKFCKVIYIVIFVGVIPLGSVISTNDVWSLADIFNGLMAFPNIIAIILLNPIVIEKIKIFKGEDIAKKHNSLQPVRKKMQRKTN